MVVDSPVWAYACALLAAFLTVFFLGPAIGLLLIALGIMAWLIVARPIWMVAAYAAIICANVADVATDVHGLPPIGGLMVPVLAAALMLRASNHAEDISANMRLLLPALAYFLVHAIALLWVRETAPTATDLIGLSKNLLIVLVLTGYLTTMTRLRTVMWSMAFAIAVVAALSVVQYATGTFDDTYFGFANASMKQIVGETNTWRVSGPLPDPNYFGQLLVLGLPLALAVATTDRRPLLQIFGLIGALLIVAAIFLTFSRGALLGVAVMILAGVLTLRSRWVLLMSVGLVASVAALVAPSSYFDRITPIWQAVSAVVTGGQFVYDPALSERISVVTAAIEMFRDNPLFGIGTGQFPTQFADYALNHGLDLGAPPEAHSMFLEKLAETGLLGFSMLIATAVTALTVGIRARRRLLESGHIRDAAILRALLLSFVGYLTTAIFLHGAYERFFWLLAALLFASWPASTSPLSARTSGHSLRR